MFFLQLSFVEYTAIFRKWEKKSGAGDGEIDFENLKRLMESLGCPQTHLELKVRNGRVGMFETARF